MSDDATRYPLAWPAGWKRTTSRRQAMFSKKVTQASGYRMTANLTVGDGLKRLMDELRRLGARNPLQLGAAVLLDKPIIVIAPEGTILPPKLAAIAASVQYFIPHDLPSIEHATRRALEAIGVVQH